ncbi:glutamine--tRNA ligase/YqeY domain fusion protein [Candidatus Ichthyocystis hellenicum]|uniref:Glutamine--tRNA ligase n=1 Tax=Candidatus Ichthyocystis hellenicum TaxID=1561003 RepID=A0A0S4LZA1_9BURK|nr:glutamine--tRNA ligase/YqeY domain fusion protein [Candidatus Ichthyocystis hellenicum]CUT16901.1 glutaminyl-tRNA synthetase [Candidatus Ichthyocystis hellenicum]
MSLLDNNQPELTNFIQKIIDSDIKDGLSKVLTRFPPEPNGYLHIGHAKSIHLNFSLAKLYGGICNLRFDDTNPSKESEEFIESIKETIKWLGYDCTDYTFYASSYFEKMYEYAEYFIEKELAYVDAQSHENIRSQRGTLTQPGKESPSRYQSADINLSQFREMRAGKFPDGSRVLRLKIDMSSTNMNMRDPVIYRIKHKSHHQVGDSWCIYPLYDYAHCISDAIEGITHSLCTLEFQDHRPLYDWILTKLKNAGYFRKLPRQIEFSRLNVTHTVTSKRKLQSLVEQKIVDGWDDPRMPTLSGLRRRGFTPESINNFCRKIGVTKVDSWVEYTYLEECLREHLNITAQRRMAVINPIKVVITNYPKNTEDEICYADNHPLDKSLGQRKIFFGRELYIDNSDFMIDPPPKFFRLSVGKMVRLRYSYIIICDEVVCNEDGQPSTLLCRYLEDTKSGNSEPNTGAIKVKGNIHWLNVSNSLAAEVRIYDHIFSEERLVDDLENLLINKDSASFHQCFVEPALVDSNPEEKFQFERLGYFVADRHDHITREKLCFNRIASLKSSKSSKF